jgi:hypothetical protein
VRITVLRSATTFPFSYLRAQHRTRFFILTRGGPREILHFVQDDWRRSDNGRGLPKAKLERKCFT